MPVIPGPWEAEVGGLRVEGQPRQTVSKTVSPKKNINSE
jgi:hypothetical protein